LLSTKHTIMKRIKNLLNKVLTSIGIEVRKINFYNSSNALIKKCLDYYKVDLVIDVGANIGQYGMGLRKAGYEGRILSFEPLKNVFRELKLNCIKHGNWDACNLGVGSENGELKINIARNFESSSFLPVTEMSINAAPESEYFNQEIVEIITLSSFFSQHEHSSQNLFLKIDVQGFEIEVLKGIELILPKVKAIQVEMSFVPLYENGPLYQDIILYLDGIGFEIYTILPDFRDPISGRMLQADGIFVRKSM
jgi:FkbM family methyltransferase